MQKVLPARIVPTYNANITQLENAIIRSAWSCSFHEKKKRKGGRKVRDV